jgi:hypothetical protein
MIEPYLWTPGYEAPRIILRRLGVVHKNRQHYMMYAMCIAINRLICKGWIIWKIHTIAIASRVVFEV